MMMAIPCPPPIQAVAIPNFLPSRLSVCARVRGVGYLLLREGALKTTIVVHEVVENGCVNQLSAVAVDSIDSGVSRGTSSKPQSDQLHALSWK